MRLATFFIAAGLASIVTAASAATVHGSASYQLFNFSTAAGITSEWLPYEPFGDTLQDGTGAAATTSQSGGVSADASTSGRSSVPMDYAQAQVFSRDRLSLVNNGPYQATFGGRILPHLSVEISGNNDGQSLPEGLFGELANAVAAINVILTIFKLDNTEVQTTYVNAALDLGFGETGKQEGTGGGSGGWAFVSALLPGERAELVFETSAIANAWHADPLGTPVSAVPVPATLPLLVGGLAALGFAGWRRNRHA